MNIRLAGGEVRGEEHSLDLGYRFGSSLIGEGFCEPTSPNKSNDDDCSTLFRKGMSTEPLVRMPGAYQRVKTLNLRGCEWGVTRPLDQCPEAGIYIDRPEDGKGIGTGKHVVDEVFISDCQYAVLFGDSIGSDNGDNCTFDHLHVQTAKAIARFQNSMAMGNQFRWVRAMGIQNGYDIAAGGKFHAGLVRILNLNGVTKPSSLLNFGAYKNFGKPIGVNIGSNNDSYSVDYIETDSQCGKLFRLLTLPDHYPSCPIININGGLISYDGYFADKELLIEVCNPCQVNIRQLTAAMRATILVKHSDKYPPVTLNFEECQPGVDDARELFHPDSSSKFELNFRQCLAPSGKSINSEYVRL